MGFLNVDTVDLLSRRVVDVAATTRGVRVYLKNDDEQPLSISTFKVNVNFFLQVIL
jgi:hypothetical protein